MLSLANARIGCVLRAKWRLDHVLGVGGMATVYAATHRNGKRGAVKILHAYQKSSTGRTREQPRQKRCPEVPEVELARGARREASIGDILLPVSFLLSWRRCWQGKSTGSRLGLVIPWGGTPRRRL